VETGWLLKPLLLKTAASEGEASEERLLEMGGRKKLVFL